LAGVATALPLAAARAAAAIAASARAGNEDAALGALAELLACASVPLLCANAGTIALGMLDGGLSLGPIRLSFEKLAPAAGLKRIFSREAVVTAARAALACTASLAVLAPVVRTLFAQAVERGTPGALIALALDVAGRACGSALAVGALFAFVDYGLTRRRWLEGLRMTHDELRRDLRENEGDPHAKGRRASFHRALVRGSIARLREAAFVVANPEHIAVALEYDPPRIAVPQILVRAAEEQARHVKALASEYGIPVIEDVALARALFAGAGVGEPIPRELYLAVAQIVASLPGEGVRP
jgi:flagellar biosynthetic protein FlhB